MGLLWQVSGGAGIPGVFCFPLMLVRTDSCRKILLRFMVAVLWFSGEIGINGHSAILAVAPETGRILHRHE
jgi:hypothetical protein